QVDEGRSGVPAGILEAHARLAGRREHSVGSQEVDRPGPRPGALVADQRPTLDPLGHLPEPRRGAGEPRADEPPVPAAAELAGLGGRAPYEFLGRTEVPESERPVPARAGQEPSPGMERQRDGRIIVGLEGPGWPRRLARVEEADPAELRADRQPAAVRVPFHG